MRIAAAISPWAGATASGPVDFCLRRRFSVAVYDQLHRELAGDAWIVGRFAGQVSPRKTRCDPANLSLPLEWPQKEIQRLLCERAAAMKTFSQGRIP
jgi:hypothetical protein